MTRLPNPGGDNGTWGDILNQFLDVSHNADGSLKSSAVTVAGAASDSSVVHNTGNETVGGIKTFSSSPVVPSPTNTTDAANKTYVDSAISAGAPDASSTTKGILKLTNDLGGTADLPTVPGLANKADKSTTFSAGTGLTGGGDLSTNRTLTVSYGTTTGTAAQGNDSRITGAIQSSTATTKGDLLAATAASTITRQGVGSDGQVLTADSTQSTGIKWNTPATAPVTSVFTRTGAVTAQSGDYTFTQVGASQGLTPTAVKTSAYSAAAGDFVPVDTTSGSVTITLPTTPADGSRVGIKHIIQSSTNTVSIATGGSDVFNKTGGGTSLTLTLLNQGMLLQYKSSTGIWYVQADDLALSTLDTRYPRANTVVVAASNSTYASEADYVCTGTADQTIINTAINSVGTLGGRVLLRAGQYNISGPIVIDRSWTSLEGEARPMWGAYFNHEGNACSKIKVTTTGINAIEIHGANAETIDGGTKRHQGIAIRRLYLYGYNQTGTGIYNAFGNATSTQGGEIDWSSIEENQISNFAAGISLYADSPDIRANSVQGNGTGYAVALSGGYGHVTENLIFDNAGTAIGLFATGTVCSGNTVGCFIATGTVGIYSPTADNVISGNHISAFTSHGIFLDTGSIRNTVIGNTLTFAGTGSLVNTSGDGIRVVTSNHVISGNNLYNAASSSGYAVAFRSGTGINCSLIGNVITGSWNNGGSPVLRAANDGVKTSSNFGYNTSGAGQATVADGGTIAHGLAATPISVRVVGSVGTSIVSVAAVNATNITVNIKNYDGSAAATQTIYWSAEITDTLTSQPGPAGVTSGITVGWYKADSLGLSNNATVTTWTDSSGNGYNLTAFGSPTFKTSVLNGEPSVLLNGTSGYLKSTAFPVVSQPITVYIVARQTATSGSAKTMVSSVSAGSFSSIYYDGTQHLDVYNSIAPGASATTTNGNILEVIINGASSQVSVDGGTAVTGTVSTNLSGGLHIGVRQDETAEFFNGDIFEVVIYSGVLSTGDRTAVRAALGTKYGITTS